MTTQEEIIALARECGIKAVYATSKNTKAVKDGFSMSGYFKHLEVQPENLEAFYHAAQRQAYERAAEVAESIVLKQSDHINGGKPFKDHMHWEDIATAIRDLIEGETK